MGSVWRPLPDELPFPARLLTEHLRTLKDEHHLSLADIAAATHYSRASWERWLNGKRLVTQAALLSFTAMVGTDDVPLLELLDQARREPRSRPDRPPGTGQLDALEPIDGEQSPRSPAPSEDGSMPRGADLSGIPTSARATGADRARDVLPARAGDRQVGRNRRVSKRTSMVVAWLCVASAGAVAVLVAAGPGANANAGTGTGAGQLSQGRALSKLLGGAADSRAVAVAAVVDIEQCQNLQQAAHDLSDMGSLRGSLVDQLSRLRTDQLAQHQALVSDLAQGWQASQRADDDYSRWAQDSTATCARVHRPADTAWKLQGDEASAVASAAKQPASELWNAIAEQDGLARISTDQL